MRQRWRLRVEGVVQGVGFRPFIARIANAQQLDGVVGNDSAGVFIEVEGEPSALASFVRAVEQQPPPLARVDRVAVQTGLPIVGSRGFDIVASSSGGRPETAVPADAATCTDCLRELRDPGDRRYRYPFINCTNCGPRYTIVEGIPYDRAQTTMRSFAMCARCQAEYDDPLDRRYHAQPLCCPDCGPTLALETFDVGRDRDPIAAAAALLADGAIVAVKGLGGYHLAVSARDDEAVARLRARKRREERPFALMVRDVEAARELCVVDDDEERLLRDPAAPIVLLRSRDPHAVAGAVAPGRRELGLMLAYTPVHHLLTAAHDGPLVLTSGNLSDEPIAYDDADARERLTGVADGFLTHDRAIRTRVDDSVVRVTTRGAGVVRRSRGYVPAAVRLPWSLRREVLGCGAELKNTFCLGRRDEAVMSHHIGDLESYEAFAAYVDGIAHLSRLFDVRPEVAAYDLHPDYLSTKHAQELDDVALVGVQHHHAHIASCLADNGWTGPVIGVAFDGLGWGDDGTLWGGEFLVADLVDSSRAAHLVPVPMPGAAAAVRQPWRMALAYLEAAYDGEPPAGLGLEQAHPAWPQVAAAVRAGVNAPLTSSMGRLFDAAAAVLGVRSEVSYEGQAAIELEQLADPHERGHYPLPVTDDDTCRIDGPALIRAVVDDRLRGTDVGVLAARFHNSVTEMVVAVCARLREQHSLGTVALSGGVWQNVRLLERCTADLTTAGFDVAVHRQVPTNDGGVSLGQVAVAGARDRAGLVPS